MSVGGLGSIMSIFSKWKNTKRLRIRSGAFRYMIIAEAKSYFLVPNCGCGGGKFEGPSSPAIAERNITQFTSPVPP